MNIRLNPRIIKDRCGLVSFKRGEAYFRADKIAFDIYNPDLCEAKVVGIEDFQVIIKKEVNGGFHTKCSCPSLTSIQRDCQHIAAVLLSIYEYQRQGTHPVVISSNQGQLSEGLLTLFNNQPKRLSRHQLHFEDRLVVDTTFICKPITINKDSQLLGIEMEIASTKVEHIREFLKQVQNGRPISLSSSFTYNPSLHCFQKEADEVIQQLIQVIDVENVYIQNHFNKSEYTTNKQLLLIPPSSWEQLIPLLIRAPFVQLIYNDNRYDGIKLSDELLPLQFEVEEIIGKGLQLIILGLNQLILLTAYRSVLSSGKVIQLNNEDYNRLAELKQMLDKSATNVIMIPDEKIGLFLEKVWPGLKKLGSVKFDESFSIKIGKTPLVAKLYLDRVNNRLLAGLDFHYENVVFNPLESRKMRAGSLFVRDVEKEEAILQLMEDSLFAKTDSGYFLHNEELEYDFLYNIVPKLENLVQIYATTAVRNRIFRGNAFPKIRVKFKKERTNWLEFKFELEGIHEKDIREVLLALEEKQKYYRLRNGALLSLETREFEEINRFLNGIPGGNAGLKNGLTVPIVQGMQLLDTIDRPHTFAFEESFRQFLESLDNPQSLAFIVPQNVETILRDYQILGFKWMKTLAHYGFGGVLADDMGLGKTLQSITFILSVLQDIRSEKLPVLIVCPSSLTYNWLSECMKFAPTLHAVVLDGNSKERAAIQKKSRDMDVVITSYPLLRSDIQWFAKQTFHSVFFDEAQAFKNPMTQTARAVKQIKAGHRFALTGTPIENSLEELWSIFHVVFPELLQSLKEYSNLSRAKIARRIRPFLLRRLKKDVLEELPEKIESLESVELLPEQKKLYAAYLAKLRHDTLKHLDKNTLRKNKIKILAGLTRLRQISCHPALFVDGYQGSSAKFEQLMQIIEEAQLSGRRLLIFSQFTKMLELIGRELAYKGLPFFYLDGKTPSEERLKICNQFNGGERDLFLISLKAGGTGLNLTGADTVILYDIWWNPAVEEQAADRVHRIGQTNVVQVIKLIARGTIEEKMNELQEKKRDLIEEIIDSREEKASSSLTEEDIREILML